LKNAVERAVIMARGDRIGVHDIMPRHLRAAGEVPSAVTIPVGASMSDARRQLVLRTFASTDGDLPRTAKLLGVAKDEVRAELQAMLDSDHDEDDGNGRKPAAGEPPRSPVAPKKPAPKKR
jgi:DNA-binding NtrC family response regulator